MDLSFYKKKVEGWCRYGFSTGGGAEHADVYLEFPEKYDEWTDGSYDAIVILALHHIMRQDEPCHIHTQVDTNLLEGLEEYMRIWQAWCPGVYHCVPLLADEEVARPSRLAERNAISAFSGGVDANYCIYGHKNGLFGRNSLDVRAAVLLHGTDIALNQTEPFEYVFSQSKENLAALGIELVPMRTNYRSHPHNWEHCFNVIICAALRMFGGKFSHGTYATDKTCHVEQNQLPWGENPIVDHYESTPWFAFYPAGIFAERTERCRYISQFPAALKHLRVCWQHDANGRNCGKCEKCLRTQLNFIAANYRGPLPFNQEFDVRLLKALPDWEPKISHYFREIINYHEHVSHSLPKNIYKPLLKKLERSEHDVHHPWSRRLHQPRRTLRYAWSAAKHCLRRLLG